MSIFDKLAELRTKEALADHDCHMGPESGCVCQEVRQQMEPEKVVIRVWEKPVPQRELKSWVRRNDPEAFI